MVIKFLLFISTSLSLCPDACTACNILLIVMYIIIYYFGKMFYNLLYNFIMDTIKYSLLSRSIKYRSLIILISLFLETMMLWIINLAKMTPESFSNTLCINISFNCIVFFILYFFTGFVALFDYFLKKSLVLCLCLLTIFHPILKWCESIYKSFQQILKGIHEHKD